MIDQNTTLRQDSLESQPQNNDINILKQKGKNITTIPSQQQPTQIEKKQNYFHNDISNDKDRNLLLKRIIKDYEQNNLSSPSSPEILSKCNSRDSLSSLIATNSDSLYSINKKKYILNDTSSYSHYSSTISNIPFISTPYSKQTNFLKPSMVFTGYQISGYKRYQVTVTLKTVNFPSHYTKTNVSSPHMTGFLSIKGLTHNHDEISTFFESFAVTDNNFGFLSSSWNHDLNLTSFDLNDMEHWLNFPAFKEMFHINQFNNNTNISTQQTIPNYIKDYLNERYIFMRWKEKFLIEDPDVDGIEGASFDGYYYIVHDQFTGNIQGFYYHKDAERFQQLELLPYAKIPGNSSHEFA
ncbi:vacuolar import and degradation protein 24 [Monosporozyma unispora]|nr:hypothetical protein C6P44_002067 [Kazachstania unispora]